MFLNLKNIGKFSKMLLVLGVAFFILFSGCSHDKKNINDETPVTTSSPDYTNDEAAATTSPDYDANVNTPAPLFPYYNGEKIDALDNCTVYYINDEFVISLYDKDEKLAKEFSLPKEPSIKQINGNIISVFTSIGSYENATNYFNIDEGTLSKPYEDVLLYQDDKVVYLSNYNIISVESVFDDNSINKEITIDDASPAVNIYAVIKKVEFVDPNSLLIRYIMKGKDYIETEKIFSLDS